MQIRRVASQTYVKVKRSRSSKMNNMKKGLVLCMAIAVCCLSTVRAQRDNDDDFEDSGFDDSGYGQNNQPSRDAEESNQNPSNYSPANEEDLEDDDDADETQQVSQSSSMNNNPRMRQRQQQQQQYYGNVAPQPFYAPPNSVLLAGFDPTQAGIYNVGHQARYRRSVDRMEKEKDIEDGERASKRILSRRKRYAKKKKSAYIGPVYTYVKTDKHAHYKWGVKHKVGKHYGRR